MHRDRRDFVEVPVPADLVEDVYAFLASKRSGTDAPPSSAPSAEEWGEERVRKLAGHPNDDLQAFLRYLAERSPAWVPAKDAMAAAGKDMKGAGGFYARLNRSSKVRYGLPLPVEYDRLPIEGEPQRRGRQPLHYRMPERAAKLYLAATGG